MMGVLQEGIACFECAGKGCIQTGEDETDRERCPVCRPAGLVKSLPDGFFERLPNIDDMVDTVMLILAGRERPPTPLEWLSFPAQYVAAYRVIASRLGEFDELLRKKAERDQKESGNYG